MDYNRTNNILIVQGINDDDAQDAVDNNRIDGDPGIRRTSICSNIRGLYKMFGL